MSKPKVTDVAAIATVGVIAGPALRTMAEIADEKAEQAKEQRRHTWRRDQHPRVSRFARFLWRQRGTYHRNPDALASSSPGRILRKRRYKDAFTLVVKNLKFGNRSTRTDEIGCRTARTLRRAGLIRWHGAPGLGGVVPNA